VILTDREIQIAIARGLITIDPLPTDQAYSSTSVDLTLFRTLTVFKQPSPSIRKAIDPTHKDYDIDEALAELAADHPIPDGGFELLCRA